MGLRNSGLVYLMEENRRSRREMNERHQTDPGAPQPPARSAGSRPLPARARRLAGSAPITRTAGSKASTRSRTFAEPPSISSHGRSPHRRHLIRRFYTVVETGCLRELIPFHGGKSAAPRRGRSSPPCGHSPGRARSSVSAVHEIRSVEQQLNGVLRPSTPCQEGCLRRRSGSRRQATAGRRHRAARASVIAVAAAADPEWYGESRKTSSRA